MSANRNGRLEKAIGPVGAITLAIGMVIGAGTLALPGVVFVRSGDWASMAWLLTALLVLPLLAIFAWLGRHYPSAGGIAGFVGEAYPRLRASGGYLLLGTFALGIPAIALTGGSYVATSLWPAPGPWHISAIAALLLALALSFAWRGAKFAGRLQSLLVAALVGGLAVLAAFGFASDAAIAPTNVNWRDIPVGTIWSGMTLCFFAYTGWEMLAFTAEEFRNPRRDFPLAVAVSFVVVVAIYVGASLAVQASVAIDDPRLSGAPFVAVLDSLMAHQVGSYVLLATVVTLIVVNLNAAVWAASRLMFDLGCAGTLPGNWGLDRLAGPGNTTPRTAILAVGAIFLAVLLLAGANLVSLNMLLSLAGQNFFVLYVLATVAFLKLHRSTGGKLYGAIALAISLVFMSGWGFGLVYAAALLSLPLLQRRRPAVA